MHYQIKQLINFADITLQIFVMVLYVEVVTIHVFNTLDVNVKMVMVDFSV